VGDPVIYNSSFTILNGVATDLVIQGDNFFADTTFNFILQHNNTNGPFPVACDNITIINMTTAICTVEVQVAFTPSLVIIEAKVQLGEFTSLDFVRVARLSIRT